MEPIPSYRGVFGRYNNDLQECEDNFQMNVNIVQLRSVMVIFRKYMEKTNHVGISISLSSLYTELDFIFLQALQNNEERITLNKCCVRQINNLLFKIGYEFSKFGYLELSFAAKQCIVTEEKVYDSLV